MRVTFLKNRLTRLNDKMKRMIEKVGSSQDAAEVRSLTEEMEELKGEIRDTEEEIRMLEHEASEARDKIPEGAIEARSEVPEGAVRVNGESANKIVGSFRENKAEERGNVLESLEYRTAFMKHIQAGIPMPSEVRGEAISAEDTGAAIPITVMNEVINTVRKRYGNLYSKVRKMNVPGGVVIPIGSLSATFKWISDDTVSPRQKLSKLGKISFGYHMAEIRIAQTFLSQILTLPAFEAEISRVIAVAYLEAMDKAIVNGSGSGAPLGILNDPRVTNSITMTAAAMSDWTKWRKNFFSQLPLGYRSGEFIFAASTVDAYLETMADSNNNPIFRQATGLEVNDGDSMDPNGRFFGRRISMVEPDILPDFDAANQNDVIGIYWQPEEYAINENFGFTMRRYFDEDTDEWVDKALTVVDGKILNPTGYYLIKKG